MHLAGVGRVNLVNYSTCPHRLARVVVLSTHLVTREDNNCNGGRLEQSGGGPGHCQTHNLSCWSACSRDGLRGGPRHVRLGGEQRPGKLDSGHWWGGGWGWWQQGGGGRGHPWHHHWQQGRPQCRCKHLEQTATEIAQTFAPTLTCVACVTGEGHDEKAIVVLIAILVGRGLKLILTCLNNFLVLVIP
jgi:hypothetical protein